MENEEFIREFLEESEENLDQLDQDFVALEQQPRDHDRLDSIYRTIHTIKGTSGFFNFSKLGALAHSAENLLSHLREGSLTLNEELTSALLDAVDGIRKVLASIGQDGDEGDGNYRELNNRLDALAAAEGQSSAEEGDASEKSASATVEAEGQEERSGGTKPQRQSLDSIATATVPVTTIQDGVDPATEGTDVEFDSATGGVNPADTQPMEVGPVDERESPGTLSGPDSVEPNPTATTPPDERDPARVGSNTSEGSIRVDVGLLNKLMDLVGELVLARNQLLQVGGDEPDRRLTNVTQQVNRITTELQERVMKTRMQPIGNIWGKFPRIVRDLAVMCGKEVDLIMDGQETEVDKSLLEAIKDPLTHLIRNSIDHGIENASERQSREKPKRGQLHLRAWHQGGQVNIEISDNGRGIDPEAIKSKAISKQLITSTEAAAMTEQQLIQLIFRPAFSTAQQVTGISGRGVGMDVVRTNIESIGGSIDIHSRIGIGTAIKIKIPLTLAIVPALIISSGKERFAIPQGHLVEMLRLEDSNGETGIESVRSAPVYRLRGQLLPLVYLSKLFKNAGPATESQSGHVNIVVLQADNCRFGLVVDHVERTEEIVVKPLHRALSVIPHLAGATVMGDGRVALILDVLGLAGSIGLTIGELKRENAGTTQQQSPRDESQMLVFALRSGRRLAMPLSEVDRLEDFPVSAVEHSDRMQVVQYRDQIMPLIELADVLAEPSPVPGEASGTESTVSEFIKAVVIRKNGHSAAIAVEDILDVGQQMGPIQMMNQPGNPIRGSIVIEGKVTDVLDVPSLVRIAGVDLINAGK
jgi:two-component system, chemotaxis family, sensor kinase CheA